MATLSSKSKSFYEVACLLFLKAQSEYNKSALWAWEDANAMASTNSTLNIIITEIFVALFSAEMKIYRPRYIDIIAKNYQLMGVSPNGFFYKGKSYTNLVSQLANKGIRGNLHKSLYEEMDKLLADKSQLDYDKARIKAGLVILLQNISTDQDYRDALPNCVVNLIPRLARLPRTREEAYILKNDPQKLHQYMKIVPLMEFHSASQYLY